MFDPDAGMPRINRGMVYLGACLIAGIRLARERQVNIRVMPTGKAIEESVDLAYEIAIGCSDGCRRRCPATISYDGRDTPCSYCRNS
jgi:hypothetical protein